MPGVSTLSLYDPHHLHVRIAVPESHGALFSNAGHSDIHIDLRGAVALHPSAVRVLPAVDPRSRTVPVELDLSLSRVAAGIAPGMYARVRYESPGQSSVIGDQVHGSARYWVAASAVVRRADLTGVYVLNESDRPLLRYVRLGRQRGDLIEVLSGVQVGNRVLNDPDSAFTDPRTSTAKRP